MKTRKEYLDGKCTHEEYYGQFVSRVTKYRVLAHIRMDKLKKSKDEHLNDIPLRIWDNASNNFPHVSTKMEECGDYLTLAGCVCIIKESARQLLQGAI